jgi:hypothetical protein
MTAASGVAARSFLPLALAEIPPALAGIETAEQRQRDRAPIWHPSLDIIDREPERAYGPRAVQAQGMLEGAALAIASTRVPSDRSESAEEVLAARSGG